MTKRAQKHAVALALLKRITDMGPYALLTDWSALCDIDAEARKILGLEPRKVTV